MKLFLLHMMLFIYVINIIIIITSMKYDHSSVGRLIRSMLPVRLVQKPGPEVIKLFLCSTQLSMKFQMLISIKNIKKFGFCQAQISGECYFSCS